MALGILAIHMQKNKRDPYLIVPDTKMNSTRSNDFSVRLETIKRKEENVEENLPDVGLGKDLLGRMPKAQATKAKRKWGHIKLRGF